MEGFCWGQTCSHTWQARFQLLVAACFKKGVWEKSFKKESRNFSGLEATMPGSVLFCAEQHGECLPTHNSQGEQNDRRGHCCLHSWTKSGAGKIPVLCTGSKEIRAPGKPEPREYSFPFPHLPFAVWNNFLASVLSFKMKHLSTTWLTTALWWIFLTIFPPGNLKHLLI